MAILVTGAAGFIGYHVCKALLQRGETVIGIDNLNDYYNVRLKQDRLASLTIIQGNFHFIHLDFSDYQALVQVTLEFQINQVVHLGAQAGVRYSISNPHVYLRSNSLGHLNILELCRHMAGGCRHLVYASSSSVYGGNTKLPFAIEDRVDQPVSLYAATKRSCELMSETYAHLYRLPQTGLRFFTVYGPWGRPDMAPWLFTDAILQGRPIKIFNYGDMRRDFTYIDDIVAGVLTCLDYPPPDDGQVKAGGSTKPHRLYNIGNNQSESLLCFIDVLEDAIGKKATRELLPMQPGDVKATAADISGITHDHGFRPTTSIAEGLPKFVQWFRHYHGL